MSIQVIIINRQAPFKASIELVTTALRYGIPAIASGWTGEIQIDPMAIQRGGGYGASGTITKGEQSKNVRWVDLSNSGAGFEIQIGDATHGEPLSGRVDIAVAVVPSKPTVADALVDLGRDVLVMPDEIVDEQIAALGLG